MKKFGKWTALKDKGSKYLCRCDCGTERDVLKVNLIKGTSKSCGCIAAAKVKQYNYSKRKYLIGTKVNMLIVLKENGTDKGRNVTYECKCDCGNIVTVVGTRLKSKNVFSCGCTYKKRKPRDFKFRIGNTNGYLEIINYFGKVGKIHMYKYKCDCGNTFTAPYNKFKQKNNSCGCIKTKVKYKDLTGKKFNALTVLKINKERINNSISWKCKCDCGNTTNVTSSNLTLGKVKSCGCYRTSRSGKNMVGKKFGNSIVVKELKPIFVGKVKKKKRVFLCKCSCGYERKVRADRLKEIKNTCIKCKTYNLKNLTNTVRGNYFVKATIDNNNYSYECYCTKCNLKVVKTHKNLLTNPKMCVCTRKKAKHIKKFKLHYKKITSKYKSINLKKASIEKLNKYIGKKYNRLTIIKIINKTFVQTRCTCGKVTKPLLLSSVIKGTPKSCGCLKVEKCKNRSGKNHPNWKGGVYSTSEKIRRSTKYKKWRNMVLIRDNYTCKKCEIRNVSTLNGTKTLSYNSKMTNKILIAHHLLAFKTNKKLRLNIDNGITLCTDCHNNFHIKYGNINFTFEDIVEYLNK